jgi:hypothetical protein
MAEQPLTIDKGVYLFFEMIALGCVLTGIDVAVRTDSKPIVWISCMAAGVAFFLIGIFSARILSALGSNAVDVVEWIARYTWLLVIAITAYLITTQPLATRFFALAGATAYFLFTSLTYVQTLRRDLDRYVMPRRLTTKQKRRLRAFLETAEKFSFTLNANPQDRESLEYGSAIYSVFHAAKWPVEFATSPPYEANEGLRTLVIGSNSLGTNVDPTPKIQQALGHAGIPMTGGGSVGAGEFKVYMTVGPRPLAIHRQPNVLNTIGRFLVRAGRPR